MALSLKETFYISHGSPMLAIDDSIEIRKVLKSWKNIYPQTPSAIFIISAHWDTRVPSVNIVERNDTIHNFYGFPKPLYQKDNTFVYMCGLKGMEKGIDDIMVSLAARDGIDWTEYKRQLKKAEQ